jgi:hypothetical protein
MSFLGAICRRHSLNQRLILRVKQHYPLLAQRAKAVHSPDGTGENQRRCIPDSGAASLAHVEHSPRGGKTCPFTHPRRSYYSLSKRLSVNNFFAVWAVRLPLRASSVISSIVFPRISSGKTRLIDPLFPFEIISPAVGAGASLSAAASFASHMAPTVATVKPMAAPTTRPAPAPAAVPGPGVPTIVPMIAPPAVPNRAPAPAAANAQPGQGAHNPNGSA